MKTLGLEQGALQKWGGGSSKPNLGIWESGNLGSKQLAHVTVWESGNLGIWEAYKQQVLLCIVHSGFCVYLCFLRHSLKVSSRLCLRNIPACSQLVDLQVAGLGTLQCSMSDTLKLVPFESRQLHRRRLRSQLTSAPHREACSLVSTTPCSRT